MVGKGVETDANQIWVFPFDPRQGIPVQVLESAGCGSPSRLTMDIKPGSCPNAFNPKARGTISIALPGTEEFDAENVDPATIEVNGVAPLRWSREDVATPFPVTKDACGGPSCSCWADAGDGRMDLSLKFDYQEIVEALGGQDELEDRKGESLELTMTGATESGWRFSATDCVLIVGGKP